ncbi:hypothetical protein CR155_16785 [Pollutimonas nitritireducens]|uniref:DUF2231 domain-containing protein n=1 Tax=Pollutimonas nitritireducens TaxID=2045209 RepID=A0A2N4UCI9_9BURK|nr:DUF2231 domain-containing protein [Pollutimonas nitritireducens]PLC52731.1 hypothetical protein CR155_16785 [Pollutimonas nitritireducens]
MAHTIVPRYSQTIYPLHAVLLAGALPLFLGAALSDAAYASSYEIQWNNFASWLIAGGLVLTGIALIFAIIDLCFSHRRAPGIFMYAALLLITWVLGFFNALMHARDAWASMPGGLIMSVIVTVLAIMATWYGFCTPRIGGRK